MAKTCCCNECTSQLRSTEYDWLRNVHTSLMFVSKPKLRTCPPNSCGSLSANGRTPCKSISVRFCCWLATYLFVCAAWVLFRAQGFSSALIILRKMAGLAPGGIAWLYSPLLLALPIVIVAHVIGLLASRGYLGRGARLEETLPAWLASLYASVRAFLTTRTSPLSGLYVLVRPSFFGGFLIASWLLALLLFAATGANPFVYFQF